MKCLFMTVGTGEKIEHGMLASIRNHNPDKIVFLASKEAIQKKKPLLEEELKKLSSQYEWKEISSPEELEKCIEEFENSLKDYNFKDCHFAFDITFGSKPMTAALTIVASMIGDSISYVTGAQRDEHGKVISGTERVITTETKILRVRSAIKKAITLFNEKLFNAAKKLLVEHRELLDERLSLRRYLEALLLLIDLQLAREDFHFEIASEKLKGLSKFLQELSKFCNIPHDKLEKFINDFISKFDDISKNPFSLHRLGELIASAERAAHIGRYNDATARLYRALEFIGQLKLKEHDLIDEDLLAICRVIDGRCEKVEDYKTRPLGLIEIYKCLYSLGYDSASRIVDIKTNQPNQLLSLRNKTILAHGFKSVRKEDYEEMKKFVIEISKEFNFSEKPAIQDLKIHSPF